MRHKNIFDLVELYAVPLLAFLSAFGFLLAALGFALLLSTTDETEGLASFRWFAYSAFPLAVVVFIAIFSRVQKRFEQRYGK